MKKGIMLLLLLSACAEPRLVREPVVVKVPVAVPCHTQEIAEPDWASSHMNPDAAPVEKLKAVLVDMNLSKEYREELKAQLEGCS